MLALRDLGHEWGPAAALCPWLCPRPCLRQPRPVCPRPRALLVGCGRTRGDLGAALALGPAASAAGSPVFLGRPCAADPNASRFSSSVMSEIGFSADDVASLRPFWHLDELLVGRPKLDLGPLEPVVTSSGDVVLAVDIASIASTGTVSTLSRRSTRISTWAVMPGRSPAAGLSILTLVV